MAKKPTSKRSRTAKPAGSARKAAAAKSAAPKAKKAAPAKKASAVAKPAKKAAAKRAAASAKAPVKAKASAKPKPAVRAKAPVKAKAPAKAAPKAASAEIAKPKAAKPKAAPRAKAAAAAPAAPQRELVDRQEPETLRLRAITPGFTVGDIERSRQFYVEGLGFTVKDKWESEGKVQGLMLIAGGCELALVQDDWAKGRDRVKGVGVRLYLDTSQDVDAIAARASAHGIAVDGPNDASWGARMLGVTDPDGFNLTIQRYTSG